MHLVSEIILPGSSVRSRSSYSCRPFGVNATPRCSISPKRAVCVPCFCPANNTVSSSALKLVWRSKIGTSRRGGPSIRILGSIPHSGIIDCTRSISSVRGVRWLIWHPENRPHQQSADVRYARRDRLLHPPLLTGASETFPWLPAQTPVPVFR